MTSDIPRAQGDHVPVLLADIYGSEDWKAFADKLHRYSTSAGLFRELAVKRLGRKPSDPFQIRVKSNGAYRNLVDVGYGVCQVLPLVHDVIRKVDGHCFLLQQPEVHLHPRAQAELGTLFGLLAKEDDKQFLVETHSDYLVDRIRIDVRKGNVAHEDVVILYFELGKNGVQVHPIFVDPRGQLIDPPPTYRQFFLEEERRFLGLD